MALTDIVIRKAKPGSKALKFADGGGLYLLLNPNGSRWWWLDYRFDGKRKTLSLGVYPVVIVSACRTPETRLASAPVLPFSFRRRR
jgi:hypothetical protein